MQILCAFTAAPTTRYPAVVRTTCPIPALPLHGSGLEFGSALVIRMFSFEITLFPASFLVF
jgi:hypothetical protein